MIEIGDEIKSKKEEQMQENKKYNSNVLPANYNCTILLEKTTIEKAKDSSFPNDAYLIWYNDGDDSYLDLVRGSRVRIFDMYYDKYGPGAVLKIDFGYGRVNPKIWGYKQPEKKKKK
jgi:hypothetical protein